MWAFSTVYFTNFPPTSHLWTCFVTYCSRNNAVYWECSAGGTSRGRCPAMVVERDGAFQRGLSHHTHEAVAGLGASVALAADVRKTASDDLYSSASVIVATAMTRVDIVNGPHDRRPNLNSVVRVR